ncbi:MAG: 30S ribosomal protein S20 [Elusimicrobiota bacterium]
MAKLKTGRHTSALKELRKSIKRKANNAPRKTYIRTLTKKIELAVKNKDLDGVKKLLNEAFSAFDRAAKTNLIHKKNSDRNKSRLAKKVSSLS